MQLELCNFEICHFPPKELLGTLPKSDFYLLKQNLKFSEDVFLKTHTYHDMKKIKDITSSLVSELVELLFNFK